MRQYNIFVAQEVYGRITIEAESAVEAAKFMEKFSPNHPYYDRIEWTPQPDDFRVVDTFDDVEYDTEYSLTDITFGHGTATCPHCGSKLIRSNVEDYEYTCPKCNEDFYKYQANYTLNYEED